MKNTDPLLLQTTVLLNRQYLLADHLIAVQGTALKELENAIAQKRQTISHVLNVYNYVIALIDHLVRYHKIAVILPRLSRKNPEYRALNEAMGELKKIRNQLQHVNNDILNDFKGPLLGGICWVSNKKQFVVTFNDIGRQRFLPCLVFDSRKKEYVHEFCYVYNEKYYDLNKAINGMRKFNEYIESLVKIKINGKVYDEKEHFMALCIEVQINSKTSG